MLLCTATQNYVLSKGVFCWEYQQVRFRHDKVTKAVLAFRGVPAEEAFIRLLFCLVDIVACRSGME